MRTQFYVDIDMTDWKKDLGDQLRHARRDSFLLQSDLRQRAGVHLNMIGRYEAGVSAPDLDVLIRLVTALDIDELRIGGYSIVIRPINDDGAKSYPKQMRLDFDKEYVFESPNARLKIQPKKEGLLIASEKRKTG